MKKNLYFRNVYGRPSIKILILQAFYFLTTPARLLIEVFSRKSFGERYFRLTAVILTAVAFALLPIFLMKISALFEHPQTFHYGGGQPQREGGTSFFKYAGWYIFLMAFVAQGIRHKLEIKRSPSVFDFARFSKSSGQLHPVFFNIRIGAAPSDIRLVECVIEPAFFFVCGLFFLLIGQMLGWLLVVCSILYSIGYYFDYLMGDEFVMDRIDEMIVNEHLEKAFLTDASEDETGGYRYRGKKPSNPDVGRKILPLMYEETEEILEVL